MTTVQTGIWLDFRDAYVITITDNGEANIRHFRSEIHHEETKGGSRSKSPWGPQFSPADDVNLERDKHAEHRYFQKIIESIGPDTEEIVIFGPAEAKIGLKKAIEGIKHYKPRLCGVLPSDYLSQNEMVALMRDFFVHPGQYLVHYKE
ncbi:MAG TPA: hypothetical protein PKL15_08900 [Saprospiraceae bacterium]|nr:hypothetical protein [Saprospiraceae bacterium]